MARPPDEQRKSELLDELIIEFGANGIGGRSLRDLAEAVGTSHRMILHYFGSRDELLVTVVEEVERRQLRMLDDLPDDPAESMARMWADIRRPEMRPFERLFFECYSRAAQGEAPFTRMVPGAVHSWLDEVDRRTAGRADRAFVRLGLAVSRGLLLDLAATNDETGVDAAAQAFIELLRRANPGAAP